MSKGLTVPTADDHTPIESTAVPGSNGGAVDDDYTSFVHKIAYLDSVNHLIWRQRAIFDASLTRC